MSKFDRHRAPHQVIGKRLSMGRARPRTPIGALAAALLVGSPLAVAQEVKTDGGSKRALSIAPYGSVAATYSDNVLLTDAARHADLVMELTGGLRIVSETSLIKGFLNYALTGQAYAQGTRKNAFQNALNTAGTLQAVDNFAYIDFSGFVGQQAISAFGVQSQGSGIPNANQSEVSTFRLSPYLRGKLAGAVDYEARYGWTNTHTGTAEASDGRVGDASLKLGGQVPLGQMAWSFDASRQTVSFTTGRTTEADRVAGTLTYPVSNQLALSLTGGRDSNNYTNAGKQSHSVVGAGVKWVPAPTTTLSANASNQSFGHGHSISFEHRTPLTAWRFSDSNGIATTPGELITNSPGSVYDLFFSQFASAEPDPVKRAVLVNTFLQTRGINPSAPVTAGYLTSAVTLLRQQDASFALLGVRDTLTFLASRSNSRRLDTLTSAVDDLQNASVVIQQGFSASYSHRLTPQTALSAIASQQRTVGSGTQPETNLRTLSVSLTSRVGSQATATFGARRSVFDSPTVPYTESALTASLNVQF